MDTPSTQSGLTNRARTSELDKFKIYFEIATTTKEERSRLKQQSHSSNR